MAKAEQTRETKRKFALWIRESSLDMAKQLYKEDNCASQSEFIEKAILFYAGYLLSGKSNRYLPNIITSTLKGIVDESDNRMSRMLFKLAVELAITMNLIAAAQDIDRVTLERLRGNASKKSNASTVRFPLTTPWTGRRDRRWRRNNCMNTLGACGESFMRWWISTWMIL